MNKAFVGLLLIGITLCLGCKDLRVKEDLDVVFGEAGGQKLLLDVFRLAEPARAVRPAIIFIHGGGWSAGSTADYRDPARAMAGVGYVIFSVNYRLLASGRNCWPAQLDDVQRAVRWVRAHAGEYGVDPQRIGAFGHSAGGHLAACLGTRETRDNSDVSLARYSSRVSCVVDMSGPSDLLLPLNAQAEGLVNALVGGPTANRTAALRDASPVYSVSPKSAPFLIVHGRNDDLVSPKHAEVLDAALRKASVESKIIMFDGEGHVLSKKANVDRMVIETLAFLKTHLTP